MLNAISDYAASVIGTLVRNRVRTVVRGVTTGKTSLINAGSNNVISFPVIASDDIGTSIIEDIAKDVETVLALATKNYIEGDISRDTSELSMDTIMASLPIARLNPDLMATTPQSGFKTAVMLGNKEDSIYAEACTLANAKLRELGSHKFRQYAEAQGIDIYRERGSYATFITVAIPYITGKQEVKSVEVQIGFEAVIRLVPKEELETRIGSFDSNRFFKNFCKLSKGEISFMNDFLLEMDRLKVEAKSVATSNHLWRKLELMNRQRDVFVKSFPFTTFVISDVVADDIRNKYAIDTNDDRHIMSLMNAFFAFAFYEVNLGTSVVKVMRDGDKMSKKLTVDDIVRNTTKVERKLRELVKLS